MVGQQVLRRVGRVFHVIGAIIVMVVAFVLPMQRRMLSVGDGIDRRTCTRQSERLPEHGQQQDDGDHCAVHGCESIRCAMSPRVGRKDHT